MSKFSGRTDLHDCIMIHSSFDEFKKRFPRIYIGHSNDSIKYKRLADLIDYYPYVPWFIYSEHKTGGAIRLSEESYVDIAYKDGSISKEMYEQYNNVLKEEKERSDGAFYEKTAGFAKQGREE